MFSVVIPTHNRLDLLRDAVETVLRQDHADWELVVFDNASTDDIRGYIESVADRRVRCERSEAFLPVTDSWNRAIDLATGTHTTFLGDDDGLAPGYFSGIKKLIDEFGSPEVIYCALYQFMHPGVAPWERGGYVADLKNGFFFVGKDSPFRLSPDDAKRAVAGSLGLRRNFTFNIQAFLFSQQFLARIRSDGPIFRSPFPDYYLANVALAKAASVLVVPVPMSIAGVSRASFGYTLFNGLEEKGFELLNAKLALDPLYPEVERFLLPGPLYHTNYVVTMEHVSRYLRGFATRPVDYRRYRRLQIYSVVIAARGRLWSSAPGKLLWSRLSAPEKAWTVLLLVGLAASRMLGLGAVFQRAVQRVIEPYGFRPESRICDKGSYSRLIQVFEALQTGSLGRPVSSS